MPPIVLIEFQSDATAQSANTALKQAVGALAQARHCAILWFADIVDRKLFRKLGYLSIYHYAQQELGFSTSRTGDFLRLAKKLRVLPGLKQELETGQIGYTKAREVIKVAGPDNEKQWLDEARRSTREELAGKVRLARKAVVVQSQANPAQGELRVVPRGTAVAAELAQSAPDMLLSPAAVLLPPAVSVQATVHKLTLELTTEQLARYEALWEKLHKLGGLPVGAGKAELLLVALAELVAVRKDSERKVRNQMSASSTSPIQIHVHQCPECEKTTVATGRGEVPLAAHEMDRLSCDARICDETTPADGDDAGRNRPNRATIPPATRHKVLSRDRHRCQAPGCPGTRFLEVHHIVPKRHGGSNEMANLTTLCAACHAALHEKGWAVTAVASGLLELQEPSG